MWEKGIGFSEGGDRAEPKPAREMGAAEWVRENLGFEGDDIQRKLLDSTNRRVILNCTRQWG
jgi:hypothetical protein